MDCVQYVENEFAGQNNPVVSKTGKMICVDRDICCECGQEIKAGSECIYETGVWEGGPGAFITCMSCNSVRNSFFLGTGWTYGNVWCDLFKHVSNVGGDIGEIHLACLHPIARDKVCDAIDRAWNKRYLWAEQFISKEGDKYIAWDETQAYEIGRYERRVEAWDAVVQYGKAYAAEMEKDQAENKINPTYSLR